MRIRAPIAGLIVVLAGLLTAQAEPRAVVELFTSQGCSSCPPADKLLGELARDDDLIALSLPVTIWDYLGWPDTLASPTLTKRQIDYAKARGDRRVYTPQAVVNGAKATVGSDRRAITRAIRRDGPLPLPVELSKVGGTLRIDIGAADAGGITKAKVWLGYYDPAVTVPIGRGENSGRTITYHNVLGELTPVGLWKGLPLSIEVPSSADDRPVDAGAVVLVQTDSYEGPGRIIGAAMLADVFGAREAQVSTRSR